MDTKNSHSETEAFRKCTRKHWYSYGLKIQPVNPSKNLVRGTLGHECLATYYRGLQAGLGHSFSVRRAIECLATQLNGLPDFYSKDELRLELGVVLGTYFKFVEAEAEEIEVLEVEKEFLVRINDEFSLPFIVDIILRYPGYGVVAWDHKFIKNFISQRTADMSPQLPLYYAGLRMLDNPEYHGAKVQYNQLRYYQAKAAQPFDRFQRTSPRITPVRIMQTVEDQIKLGTRIYNLKQMELSEWESWTIRAMDMTCDYCDFFKICNGELNGESRDLYIGTDYVDREHRR